MYGSGYGGYGGYSSYSGYGGYGGVTGGGMGGYGCDDLAMVRQAEERTRSTFQSVETVVGAFASVSSHLCNDMFECIRVYIHVPSTQQYRYILCYFSCR